MPEEMPEDKEKSCFSCDSFGVCKYIDRVHQLGLSRFILSEGYTKLHQTIGEYCEYFKEMKETKR